MVGTYDEAETRNLIQSAGESAGRGDPMHEKRPKNNGATIQCVPWNGPTTKVKWASEIFAPTCVRSDSRGMFRWVGELYDARWV